MNARNWMMKYGVAMILAALLAAIIWSDSVVSGNRGRKASCVRSGSIYRL